MPIFQHEHLRTHRDKFIKLGIKLLRIVSCIVEYTIYTSHILHILGIAIIIIVVMLCGCRRAKKEALIFMTLLNTLPFLLLRIPGVHTSL